MPFSLRVIFICRSRAISLLEIVCWESPVDSASAVVVIFTGAICALSLMSSKTISQIGGLGHMILLGSYAVYVFICSSRYLEDLPLPIFFRTPNAASSFKSVMAVGWEISASFA